MRVACLAVTASVAACGGAQVSVTGPVVSVLRQTSAVCFELMASPEPVAGLGPVACQDTGKNTRLLAGVDRVELVIDCGALDYPEAASIPAPTVTVFADGKPTAVSASIALQQRMKDHTYYLASFTAPAVISNDVRITVSVTAGYATDVATSFQTVPPSTLLSLLAQTTAGCLALASDVAPAIALALPNLCDPLTRVDVRAGVDALELVIDYVTSPDVIPDIASSNPLPVPAAVVMVDGASQPPLMVGAEQRTPSNRRYFTAHLRAPATPSSGVAFQVTTMPGAMPAQLRLKTTVATPELSIIECGPSCTATADVGVVHLRAVLPGDVPQTVAIHALLDRARIDDPVSAMTTVPVGDHTEAIVAIPVPGGVADQTIWTLQAQVAAVVTAIDVTLRKPAIAATVSCPSPCTMTGGGSLGLEVVAPLGIRDGQATYTTALGGVPQVAQGKLDLVTIDNTARTLAGTVALTAPTHPGTWTIDASVAGYHAQTIAITVVDGPLH